MGNAGLPRVRKTQYPSARPGPDVLTAYRSPDP
jgi:hypothetical protein